MKLNRIVVAVVVAVLAPNLMGVDRCGGGKAKTQPKTQVQEKKASYHYDCRWEDFYGGMEMWSWEGSATKRHGASVKDFGDKSQLAGEQPPGIGLHVEARSLTPNVPLPRGAKPFLECRIVKVDSRGERVIGGPAHIRMRRGTLFITARAS